MFFEFNQNNTGGSFDVDGKLCHRLIIEEDDYRKAIKKAEELGCYWNGVEDGLDCDCCGDRWYKPYSDRGIVIPYEYASFTKADAEKITESYDDIESYNVEKPHRPDMNFGVKFNTIESYAQYMADRYGWTSPDARIFYKNGEIKEIFKSPK